ncbi:MAG: hypothetical protein ABS04_02055 [Pelagibacteraceae bacterium BACL5 MAG-121015-bin10]|jgi:hypothetical protein|nr:MAG: hypothetical protein ABS04_02055 [Pelagibacteraceae bacterium BACL5 MAG-121015-bin10]
MKKNKDPNKVSNFKNTKIEYEYYSSFCMKTKPNNRYFKGELKRLTQEMRDTFCTEELKKENPAHYYSMMGRKLPKKYQEKPKVQITPVNAYVPPQSKLSKEELELQMKQEAEERKIKEQKAYEKKQEEIREKQRKEYNQRTFDKQQSLVFWCDAYTQANYRSIHSEEYKSKTEKKYEYY